MLVPYLVIVVGMLLVGAVGWLVSKKLGKDVYLDVLPPEPPKKLPGETERPRETGVVHRLVAGGVRVELVEEVRFLGPIPRIRKGRFVRIEGEIRSPFEAKEVSRAVSEFEAELVD